MPLKTTRGRSGNREGGGIKGRGATCNPEGRYERLQRESFDDGWVSCDPVERVRDDSLPVVASSDPIDPGRPRSEPLLDAFDTLPPLATEVTRETAKSIISRNGSPDIPFTQSVNPYRGCEHGCIYCYARPSHAYLGLSPGLDFETRLVAKPNAAALLREELAAPGYECSSIALGTNTDPYQPIERDWRITREVLEVLAECDHPFSIVTKNALVERDTDLIAAQAAKGLAKVYVSVTNLDTELARKLEPRAAAPHRRFTTIKRLADAGIPVGVMVAPVIPIVTDRYMEEILERAREAGATTAGYILLRLPHEVAPIFREWLAAHFPLRATHVMSVMRQMRGGADYVSTFGERHRGTGEFAELLERRFEKAVKRLGFDTDRSHAPLDTSQFRKPGRGGQMALF